MPPAIEEPCRDGAVAATEQEEEEEEEEEEESGDDEGGRWFWRGRDLTPFSAFCLPFAIEKDFRGNDVAVTEREQKKYRYGGALRDRDLKWRSSEPRLIRRLIIGVGEPRLLPALEGGF